MDGFCQFCRKKIQWQGKERRYCSDACKQMAFRERKLQEKQARIQEELIQLRTRLKRLGFSSDAIEELEKKLEPEENEDNLRILQVLTNFIERYLQSNEE